LKVQPKELYPRLRLDLMTFHFGRYLEALSQISVRGSFAPSNKQLDHRLEKDFLVPSYHY